MLWDEPLSDSGESSTEASEIKETDALGPAACLAGVKLFQGCSSQFLDTLVKHSTTAEIDSGNTVNLENGGPLFVVTSGALSISVGAGRAVIVGPGAALNAVGMLGLLEHVESAELTRKQSTDPQQARQVEALLSKRLRPYYQETLTGAMRPSSIFTERQRRAAFNVNRLKIGPAEDALCMYGLCPLAVLEPSGMGASTSSASAKVHKSQLPFHVVGADPGQLPRGTSQPCDYETGGATLVAVTMEQIQRAFVSLSESDKEDTSPDCFAKNVEELSDTFSVLVRRCCLHAFPGVPPEVMWALAEGSQHKIINGGHLIVEEGDDEASAGDLIIIEDGSAVIEKAKGVSTSTGPEQALIGRLGPGAIIGDLCMSNVRQQRGASVRAAQNVELITVPAHALHDIVCRFPGILQELEGRIRDTALAVQMKLPMRSGVLPALRLFQGLSAMDSALLHEIEKILDRKCFYEGQYLQEEGSSDSDFHALEFGDCEAEATGETQVMTLGEGHCIVDAILDRPAASTVRAITPFVLTLSGRRQSVRKVLGRCPQADLRQLEADAESVGSCQSGFKLARILAEDIPIFSPDHCSKHFLESLAPAASHQCFLPGQTLAVQGSNDSCKMFWLRGGRASIERDNVYVGELDAGSSVGEFMMVGAMCRWPQTIRAQTFCHVVAISRDAFSVVAKQDAKSFKKLEEHASSLNVETLRDMWPTLGSEAPPRLLLRLNQQASRCSGFGGESSVLECSDEFAVLALIGDVTILDEEGMELAKVPEGTLWNEEALLGLPQQDGRRAMNVTSASRFEVLIVSKKVWEAAFEGLESHRVEMCNRLRLAVGQKRARQNFDVELDSLTLLRRSTLLRLFSDPCAASLASRCTVQTVSAGETIHRKRDRKLCLLVDGEARLDGGNWGVVRGAGEVFGDSSLLGLWPVGETKVQATTLCVVLVLAVDDFRMVLKSHPDDEALVVSIQSQSPGYEWVDTLVGKISAARRSGKVRLRSHDVEALFRNAQHVFAEPGRVLVEKNIPAKHAPLFLVVSGCASVEGDHGVVIETVGPGTFLDEGPACGFTLTAEYSIRCRGPDTLHCVMLVPEAYQSSSLESTTIGEYFDELHDERIDFCTQHLTQRSQWLHDTVYPALGRTQLLAGCSAAVIEAVAAPLSEESYRRGDFICRLGETSDAMLVILQGEAEVLARDGEAIGALAEGASINDINALGLLDRNPAAVRAASKVRVIRVSAAVLAAGLSSGDPSGKASLALERLVDARRSQVLKGLPLGAVTVLGVPQDDICGRLAALYAEAVPLTEGEIWDPVPDDDPLGPSLGFFLKGTAEVVFASSGRQISRMPPGSVFPEGLLAARGAQVRAISNCKGYRIRVLDLGIAMAAVAPSKCTWYQRYAMYTRETFGILEARLRDAEGVHMAMRPHPAADSLAGWQNRRQRTITRAKLSRTEKLDLPDLAVALCPAHQAQGPKIRRQASEPSRRPDLAKTETSTAWQKRSMISLEHSESAPNMRSSLRAASREGLRRRSPKLATAALHLPALPKAPGSQVGAEA